MHQMEKVLHLLNPLVQILIQYIWVRKYIALIIIGIKLKLITNKLVFIDKNLERINKSANNIADKTIFFVLDTLNLNIKNSPFLFSANK